MTNFSQMSDVLCRRGYRVIRFDMPAHGQSPGRRTSVLEFAEVILRVSALVGPLHGIVGHSLGGMATALALSRGLSSNVAAFVAPMNSFEFAINGFSSYLGLDQQTGECLAQFVETHHEFQRAELNLLRLIPPRLPIQIIHDEDDLTIPISESRKLAEAWDRAELVETSGLGHRRILKDEKVIEHISRFFTAQ